MNPTLASIAETAAQCIGFALVIAWSMRGGLRRALRTELDDKLPKLIASQVRIAVREELTDIVCAVVRGELRGPEARISRLEGEMRAVFNVLSMRRRGEESQP
jgi:hypothetical protein